MNEESNGRVKQEKH